MTGRLTRILDYVTECGRVEVAKLAEQLGVSQVTVRKDLDQLEGKGLIRREHGFAVTSLGEDVASRLAYHYENKRALARTAAALVRDGETVMIESGSCCVLLAEELARTRQGVTIITNSAFIAGHIRRFPDTRVVVLGGDYQPHSEAMVGPLVRECAARFFVDKLFAGTDGFHENYGFTGRDPMRAEAVRDMAHQAEKVILLTESLKFSRKGTVALLRGNEVSILITDEHLPEAAERFLIEQGTEIYKVPEKENVSATESVL